MYPTAPHAYKVELFISGIRKKATAIISVLAMTSITRSIPKVAKAVDGRIRSRSVTIAN
tara:strand:- start:203 stop:379 length:177 start_codon:yes stop_codon:yes gene_type:complete